MAFADPQSITVNSIAISMPRTGSGLNAGQFTSADGLTHLNVSHQSKRRDRHVVRVNQKKYVSDPLVPANNLLASMSCYLVIDAPKVGYTNTELKYVVDALVAYLTASSGAKVTQLLGGEI